MRQFIQLTHSSPQQFHPTSPATSRLGTAYVDDCLKHSTSEPSSSICGLTFSGISTIEGIGSNPYLPLFRRDCLDSVFTDSGSHICLHNPHRNFFLGGRVRYEVGVQLQADSYLQHLSLHLLFLLGIWKKYQRFFQ